MTSKTYIAIVVIILALCFGSIFLRKEPVVVAPPANQSLETNIKNIPEAKSMVQLAEVSGIETDLVSGGPFTIFAPNDAAFAKLPADTLKSFEKSSNYMNAVRLASNHMILNTYASSNFYDGMKLTTVNAEVVTITKKDGSWYIGDAKIIKTDVPSQNGVIHVIDKVLVPAKK